LGRIWPEIKAQLPENFAGLLAGATLAQSGGRVSILIPGERTALAEHLRASRLPGIVSGLLARTLGRKIEVDVRLAGEPGGLFATSVAVSPAEAVPVETVPAGGGAAGGQGEGTPADSLSRRARALFGAREVGKGDEHGDEPR